MSPHACLLYLGSKSISFYQQWFNYVDSDGDGRITGDDATVFFAKSNIERPQLKQVWAIADSKRQGFLGFYEFITAMQLLSLAQAGYEISADLLRTTDDVELLEPPVMEGLDLLLMMVLPIAVEDVKREVKILQALNGHENVAKFYNAFEDDSFVYIVMELGEGGELLDRILSKKESRYTEKDVAIVVRQMLKVAAECHLHGLVHHDMKPENLEYI